MSLLSLKIEYQFYTWVLEDISGVGGEYYLSILRPFPLEVSQLKFIWVFVYQPFPLQDQEFALW